MREFKDNNGEWKETIDKERNLKIYNEELKDFLPENILDFHIHVFNSETFPDNDPGLDLPGVYIREYAIPELKKDFKKIYPEKNVKGVVFGFPRVDCNSDINNDYVIKNSDFSQIFPFRLIRPEEPPEKIEKELKDNKYLGIKPYLNYVQGKAIEDIEINDMLPPGQMEVIDSLGLVIMLHIPRGKRLADPINLRQIAELSKNHPNVTIVLAHVGRAYYLKNIVGNIEKVAPLENVYCDTTMVNNWEVLEYLYSHFDLKRIVYGTDTPIGICGGKAVEINDQYTYVTSKPWKLSISDDHGKLIFTSFIYEQIRAHKKAIKRLNLSESFIEDLFYNNGMYLINNVMEKVRKNNNTR